MSDRININCGERLSIEHVERLYSEMESALTSDADVELNASAVNYCDTAGLQLVVSLRRELQKTGHDIHWTGSSDCLSETAGYLGLCSSLGLSSTQ
ncbi:STAS domain-containing protein [Bacterioplanoides sp.]|uniref:STAS domain-containing protein n=1 Tax=Bacterioplanoides sp. TaxID=2066072 RepID=UPI003B5AE7E3